MRIARCKKIGDSPAGLLGRPNFVEWRNKICLLNQFCDSRRRRYGYLHHHHPEAVYIGGGKSSLKPSLTTQKKAVTKTLKTVLTRWRTFQVPLQNFPIHGSFLFFLQRNRKNEQNPHQQQFLHCVSSPSQSDVQFWTKRVTARRAASCRAAWA